MRSGSIGSAGDMDALSLSGDPGGKDLWFQLGMERELGVLTTDNSMDSLRDLAFAIIEAKV